MFFCENTRFLLMFSRQCSVFCFVLVFSSFIEQDSEIFVVITSSFSGNLHSFLSLQVLLFSVLFTVCKQFNVTIFIMRGYCKIWCNFIVNITDRNPSVSQSLRRYVVSKKPNPTALRKLTVIMFIPKNGNTEKNSPKAMRKPCLSTKFPHQEIW